jgi:hypothetical protein
MTRVEAEQLAYTKSRNDRDNNYVAEREGDDWTVKAYPRHRGILHSKD